MRHADGGGIDDEVDIAQVWFRLQREAVGAVEGPQFVGEAFDFFLGAIDEGEAGAAGEQGDEAEYE